MVETHDEHSSPIKTPKQLITVLALSFIIPITIIVMLSQLVTTGINAVLSFDRSIDRLESVTRREP